MSEEIPKYPYSPSFQDRILAALLQDPSLYPRYYGVWNDQYFSDGLCQNIATVYFEFRIKNKQNPAKETLLNAVILRNDKSPDEFKSNLVQKINSLYEFEVQDKEWTEGVIVGWAKDQALEGAILECANYLDKGDKHKIRSVMDTAYRIGDNIQEIGTIIKKGFKGPSGIILAQKKGRIPTGFSDLDPLLEGGLSGGELFVFLGPPKGFKSGNMLNAVLPCILSPIGKNATYVSLELKEAKVLERFAYRITRMDKLMLAADPAKFDIRFEERIEQIVGGALAVKQYPTRTMTASMLRSYLDMLDAQGHNTELLVVDYGNIMKAEDKYASEWSGIGANFEALRAISIERDIPVITAARTNRESLSAEDLRMEHIAGSMEIAATCDYCVALIQSSQEHRDWTMRHKLLLNRNEDCGVVIGNDIDYPTYTITNTGIINTDEDEGEDGGDGEEKKGYQGYQKRNYQVGDKKMEPRPGVDKAKMDKLRDIISKGRNKK